MALPCLTTRVLALAVLATGLACTAESPKRERERERERDARPLVVVSVEPQRYFVERLAGPGAEVVALLPAGASPTSFEPGFDALRTLDRASLLVRVGHPHFPFERAWLDPLLRDRGDLRVIDAHGALERGDEHDPHEWLSPIAAMALVDALVPELAQLLRDEPGVHARAAVLRAEIEALDAELRATLEPVRGGRFLVLHPAWGHFANHYGLRQLAIERDGKPPGPRELAQLLELAESTGLRSVIVVPQIDPMQAHSVARAIHGRVVELDPLAADWPDSMRRTARLLASEAVLP